MIKLVRIKKIILQILKIKPYIINKNYSKYNLVKVFYIN